MTVDRSRDKQLRIIIPKDASSADLSEVFRRIGSECSGNGATRVLAVATGDWAVTRDDLRAAICGLSEAGCAGGFRLACVTRAKNTFDDIASVEDVGIRYGISTRVFFDESNAVQWLSR